MDEHSYIFSNSKYFAILELHVLFMPMVWSSTAEVLMLNKLHFSVHDLDTNFDSSINYIQYQTQETQLWTLLVYWSKPTTLDTYVAILNNGCVQIIKGWWLNTSILSYYRFHDYMYGVCSNAVSCYWPVVRHLNSEKYALRLTAKSIYHQERKLWLFVILC